MNGHRLLRAIFGLASLLLWGCGSAQPATAATGPFVYVVNTKSDEISQYSAALSDFGALRPLAPATVPTGPFPYGIVIDRQRNSVYVADVDASEVSQYTINPITGRLAPKSPATVAAGRGSVEVALTPNGKSAYVVDHDAVSQYSIDPVTGDLTPKSPAKVVTGRNAEAIAINPNGKYAYVSDCPGCSVKLSGSHSAPPSKRRTATIWEYRISQNTGKLTRMATVATGTGANAIAITPDGKSLYVAVRRVWQYTINPTTGRLTPKKPATVVARGTAHDIAIAPNGRDAYVVTVANNTVSQYRINPTTGTLSSNPVSTAHAVLHPEALKIAQDGETAYVTSENDGKISQYDITATTGKITPMSPATVATASGSLGLAITPEP
jgi:6-phosphogluconolactonase (cycloisomerase 2 family)